MVEAVEESHSVLLLLGWRLRWRPSEGRSVLGWLLPAYAHAREESPGALRLGRWVGRLHEAECVLLLRLLGLLGAHLVVVHEREGILLLPLCLVIVDGHASEEVCLLLLRRLLLVHEAEAGV